MKRTRLTVVVVFVLLAMSLLIYFLSRAQPKYEWYNSYDPEKPDAPYGILWLKTLLADYHPDGRLIFNKKQPLYKLLPSYTTSKTDYVFVGPAIYLDSMDGEALLHFAELGNDVLIASEDYPRDLFNKLFPDKCKLINKEFVETKTSNMNFFHDTLKTPGGYTYSYRHGAEDILYPWKSFTLRLRCDSSRITPLGFQDDGDINFFKISCGRGAVYVHTNPLVFTNYFLAQPGKLAYASGVFTHLTGKDIILDDYSKIPFDPESDHYNSPLYFLLNQPSLKYAWWLLLFTVVVYVFFAAKRKQRVVPVLEPKVNTSLEFIQLISTLHYQNGNPLDMARKKMKYFQYIIRSRYGVNAQVSTPAQMASLAERSKVSLVEVRNIFDQYNEIEKNAYYNTQSDKLIGLFNAIENFMKKCK